MEQDYEEVVKLLENELAEVRVQTTKALVSLYLWYLFWVQMTKALVSLYLWYVFWVQSSGVCSGSKALVCILGPGY